MSIGLAESATGRLLEGARAAADRLALSAGRSGAMHRTLERLRRLSRGDQPVWLSGEPGCGRHTAALALHVLSPRSGGPVMLLHGSQLAKVLRLLSQPDPAAAEQARAWFADIDQEVRSGTLIIDEGAADLSVRGLFVDMLGLRPRTRMVLLTSEEPAFIEPDGAELLANLRPRHLPLPPLRQRKDEIVELCLEVLREHGVADPCFDESALALLRAHCWPGNLWQVRHVMALLARAGGAATTIGADAVNELLAGPAPDPASPSPIDLTEVAAALGDLLRPMVPSVPGPDPAVALPAGTGADGSEVPWAPLLLLGAPSDPPQRHRLVLGPAPLDERRLVAGLQARPLGHSGSAVPSGPAGPAASTGPAGLARGGARTGDTAALSRLGTLWRGNLLGLLRSLHREMDPNRSPGLTLLSLGHLLLISGPPLQADALARLGLGLPVELPGDATALLCERLGTAYPRLHRPAPTCVEPTLGRTWADALRGHLPQPRRDELLAHAPTCDRCAWLLPAWWHVVEVLRQASPSDADAALDSTVPQDSADSAVIADAAAAQRGPVPGADLPARGTGAAPPRAVAPDFDDEDSDNDEQDATGPEPSPSSSSSSSGSGFRHPPKSLPVPALAGSATSPVVARPVPSVMTPLRWSLFALFLLGLLAAGALGGGRLLKRVRPAAPPAAPAPSAPAGTPPG